MKELFVNVRCSDDRPGCSRETIQIINENSLPDGGDHFIMDVNYDPDDGNGEWEDLPANLQADEAFVHALRDIPLLAYVQNDDRHVYCN